MITLELKLFKATTTVKGMRGPFVDWFMAETLDDAKAKCDAESKQCGLPMDERRTVEFVECNPDTLKPL